MDNISPDKLMELFAEVKQNTILLQHVLKNQESFKSEVTTLQTKVRTLEDTDLTQKSSLRTGVVMISALLSVAVVLGATVAKPIQAALESLTK